MRDQPDVMAGHVIRYLYQVRLAASDKPRQDRDAEACTRGGQQRVRAVCFHTNVSGLEQRLKPLCLLQNVKPGREDEKLEASHRFEVRHAPAAIRRKAL